MTTLPIRKDASTVRTVATVAADAMPSVDEASMTSWWTIATEHVDRDGDLLVMDGCRGTLANFQRNAVVLFEHGRDERLPIGTSIDLDGRPGVSVQRDCIRAGCRHHDHTPKARDVWQLVRSGVLKGASVAFLPIKAERIGDGSPGRGRLRFF